MTTQRRSRVPTCVPFDCGSIVYCGALDCEWLMIAGPRWRDQAIRSMFTSPEESSLKDIGVDERPGPCDKKRSVAV